MIDQGRTCSSEGCDLGAGPSCGHCRTDQVISPDRFVERYPLPGRLATPGIRILAGVLLFAGGLLARGYSTTSFLLFLSGYLIVGTGVIIQAFTGALRGHLFSEHFLMTVATIGAFVIGEYAEGFAVMLLYLVGEELEHRAVDRTRRSIDALNRIRPVIAHLITEEGVADRSPAGIMPDDRILVYPGERVPLDGRLENKGGPVDYSALTGESRPVPLEAGDEVMAGAINGTMLLTLSVIRDENHSAVMRIMQMAREAGHKKTRVELFTERFARVYTPVVVFLAIGIALFPPLALGLDLSVWVYRALSFLVISCPCSLVISVPLAYIAGIGNASRRGIYIRGSQYLEALTDLDTVIFDKTGTLTDGTFGITGLVTAPGVSRDELVSLAAAIEEHSTHPVADAIRRFKEESSGIAGDIPNFEAVTDFEEIAGHGIAARVGTQQILAGNSRLMELYGVDRVMEANGDHAGSTIQIAREGRWLGSLFASDTLRQGAVQAVSRLRHQGTSSIAVLSGDREAAVFGAGKAIGADLVASELLPEDKIREVENLQDMTKGRTAFVGDGINDAPVLRRADVGIAIGGLGSDAAIEAADVVIMTDELERIPDAVSIARKTKRRVHENVAVILAVKAILLTLGVLGITPLWGAVFADTGVMLLTVVNSLRAYYSRVR
ncbi:MAG: cadmium-translocating P-type ATPase [Clostridiaceae bacterium]|nr:cadmium-translocating P-type ATPase [Clostridiaceae bacterium]